MTTNPALSPLNSAGHLWRMYADTERIHLQAVVSNFDAALALLSLGAAFHERCENDITRFGARLVALEEFVGDETTS